VARPLRQVQRLDFDVGNTAAVVETMTRLAAAEDGWINMLPRGGDDDERSTSIGFLALLGGGSIGVTMITWVPGGHNRRGATQPTLGISHLLRHRVFADLESRGLGVPKTWFVEQDHPRRGLVLRLPFDIAHEEVLEWALGALNALMAAPTIRRWRAEVYLPNSS
jgi:hypothetical protein